MNDKDNFEYLQSIADITYVIHEYARLVDLNRTDEQVLCFAENGVADYFGTDIVGRKAIGELLKPAVNKWIAMSTAISNIQIQVSGNTTATSICYAHIWERCDEKGEGDVVVRGQYHDNWIKTDEGWKISRRTFLVMGATPPRPDARGIGRITSS